MRREYLWHVDFMSLIRALVYEDPCTFLTVYSTILALLLIIGRRWS